MKKAIITRDLLFWLTILSVIISFCICCIVGEVEVFGYLGIVRYSWIMYMFIPIGIMSFVLGIVLKKKGIKYKKNCIASCIVIPVLLIYGSFFAINNSRVHYRTDFINQLEIKLDLYLPQNTKAATEDWKKFEISFVKFLSQAENDDFEKRIYSDDRWVQKLNSFLEYSLPEKVQGELYGFEYYLYYNSTTKEYNSFPQRSGEYDCILLAYDKDLCKLLVINGYTLSVVN